MKKRENFKSNEPCVVCGYDLTCYHHIKTKASRPDLKYNEANFMSLCIYHHNSVHAMGTNSFIEKYGLENYMLQKGWQFDRHTQKWFLNI